MVWGLEPNDSQFGRHTYQHEISTNTNPHLPTNTNPHLPSQTTRKKALQETTLNAQPSTTEQDCRSQAALHQRALENLGQRYPHDMFHSFNPLGAGYPQNNGAASFADAKDSAPTFLGNRVLESFGRDLRAIDVRAGLGLNLNWQPAVASSNLQRPILGISNTPWNDGGFQVPSPPLGYDHQTTRLTQYEQPPHRRCT